MNLLRAAGDDPDASDVALARRGDTGAFQRLYHRHAPRLHGLALRFVGPALADDALQDIFVQAWNRLAQFRGEARFGTWVHRVAVNHLLRQVEVVRRTARLHGAIAHDAPPRGDPSPETRIDVETALLRLAPEIRAAVVLHDLEGYGHDEIARAMGISVSASKMRVHRGRLQLREWLLR